MLDRAFDLRSAQVDAAARLEPVREETGKRRAVEEEAVDDGGAQDRRRLEMTIVEPDIAEHPAGLEVEATRDPRPGDADAFLVGPVSFLSAEYEEAQKGGANDSRRA